jgi:uncharacterized protein involved in exopolysaccharide biosynthesis
VSGELPSATLPESGISIAEIRSRLWRGRGLLIVATAASVFAAALVTVATPKLYGGDAVVAIGDVDLNSAQSAIDRARANAQDWAVFAAYRAPRSYYLSLEAESPDEVQHRLSQVTDDAINELQRGLQQSQMNERHRLAAVERQLAVNALALNCAVKPRDTCVAGWAAEMESTSRGLDAEAAIIRESLGRVKGPHVLSEPRLFAKPVRPRLSWNLAFSGTLGFASAALFVLFPWRNARA